jgi:subtilisin family serine protease
VVKRVDTCIPGWSMMRSRSRWAALSVLVVLGALVPAAVSYAEQSGAGDIANTHAAAKPAKPAGADVLAGMRMPTKVTLITGDKVVVTGQTATVEPGPGRDGITFATFRDKGRVRVVPSDAWAMLRAGRLDPRLFDVTGLIEFGYHDIRNDLPLIITGGQSAGAVQARAQSADGAAKARPVPGGVAFSVQKTRASGVWRELTDARAQARISSDPIPSDEPSKIWLDGLRRVSLEQSVPQIGAPTAWAAGFTGAGVKVAVIDSGIDASHPDLAGQVVAAKDFTSAGHQRDVNGHGTHVAATIASVGSKYKGVAPGVQLLAAKACDPNGNCADSAILAAMQWAAEQGAKVINMSLGAMDSPTQDPLEAAVESLTARHNVLFVVAAGNEGADESIRSPGSADAALTVGAVTKTDQLTEFSSRGPRLGDATLKPDITAPGQAITAARSKDATPLPPGEHFSADGTSMATPHVAGAAAILAQQHPTWTPAMLKTALMASAKPNPTIAVYAQGAGRVDLTRAITQTVLAEPASVSFGRALWPHHDDTLISRTLTYRNTGSTNVDLRLSLSGGAPTDMFTLSTTTLTVPAGATAAVTITADTRVPSPDARYGAFLTAQAGDTVINTPLAVDKETERYDLTLLHLDRTGQPSKNFMTAILDPYTKSSAGAFPGYETVRLPKGRYTVATIIEGAQSGGAQATERTLLVEPEITLDTDRTHTQDARTARPITVTLPQPDTKQRTGVVETAVATADGTEQPTTFALWARSFDNMYSGPADERKPNPLITSILVGGWTTGAGDPIDAPATYNLAWHRKGQAFAGLHKQLTSADLAVVEADYARQAPTLTTGSLTAVPRWSDGTVTALPVGEAMRLPSRRLEYYNADEGIGWLSFLLEADPSTNWGDNHDGPFETFSAGQRYPRKRNYAVFGPGFQLFSPGPDWDWMIRRDDLMQPARVSRSGDTMDLTPPLLNDQVNLTEWPEIGDPARITLDRDGQRVVDEPTYFADEVAVPAGEAAYRLAVEFTRSAPYMLTTRANSAWTFRSATTPKDKWTELPLSAVRFTPPLDPENTAPAGRTFAIPVEVQPQPGSTAALVNTLTVEASYDDGATWHKAAVIRGGRHGVALVQHPAGPGFVSLRTKTADNAGNTAEHTIIRAYRIA